MTDKVKYDLLNYFGMSDKKPNFSLDSARAKSKKLSPVMVLTSTDSSTDRK